MTLIDRAVNPSNLHSDFRIIYARDDDIVLLQAPLSDLEKLCLRHDDDGE